VTVIHVLLFLEMGSICGTHGRDEKCAQYFGWKPEGKRSLERLRRRWEDNIRMDLREIGWEMLTGCIWLWTGTGGGLL